MKNHSLRVSMVTSSSPGEGIAIYSRKFLDAITQVSTAGLDVTVLSNFNPSKIDPRLRYVKCWRRNSLFYVLTILRQILRERPNLVHIQHEYLLYGKPYRSGLFPVLMLLLCLARKRIIITLHSVIPVRCLTSEFFERHSVGPRMSLLKKLCTISVTKLMGGLASSVVVHKLAAKRELVERYGFAEKKVTVIPHGVESNNNRLDSQLCKQEIGLEGGPTVTFFGFVSPSKGIENVIQALPMVLQKSPEARLVVAGGFHAHTTHEGQAYVRKLEGIVDQLHLQNRVVFTKRFLAEDELPRWLGATDVFLLPYTESDIISSSGVLATIAVQGKPIIVSDIPHFSEVKEEGLGLMIPKGDEHSFAGAITTLLADEPLRGELGLRLRRWAERNSWTRAAEMTLELYRAVAGGRPPESEL